LLAPAPLHAEHVIAVVLLGEHVAIGDALTDEDAVLDAPDLVGLHLLLGVHERPPARQVLAVEELDPAVAFAVGGSAGGEHDEGQAREAGGGKSAAVHVRTPCCQGTGTKRILGRKPSGRMGSARTDLPTDGANSHAGRAGVGSAAVGPYLPDASGAWLGSW